MKKKIRLVVNFIFFSMGNEMIYLDHNATTPILPEVFEAMLLYLTTEWGTLRVLISLGLN